MRHTPFQTCGQGWCSTRNFNRLTSLAVPKWKWSIQIKTWNRTIWVAYLRNPMPIIKQYPARTSHNQCRTRISRTYTMSTSKRIWKQTWEYSSQVRIRGIWIITLQFRDLSQRLRIRLTSRTCRYSRTVQGLSTAYSTSRDYHLWKAISSI